MVVDEAEGFGTNAVPGIEADGGAGTNRFDADRAGIDVDFAALLVVLEIGDVRIGAEATGAPTVVATGVAESGSGMMASDRIAV